MTSSEELTTSSIVVVVILIIVGILALVLNAIVLDTLVRRTDLEATDLLMCHLAVTDMLTGLLVFQHVLYQTIRFEVTIECHIRLGSTIASVSISVYHLAFLTLDRYLKIVYPYRYSTFISRKSVSIMSAVVWIVSVNFGFLLLYGWNNTPGPSDPPCSIISVMTRAHMIVALVSYCIPVNLIGFMYIRIYLVARRHAKAIAASDVNAVTNQVAAHHMRFAKTVVLLIGSYCVTILPLALFMILYLCTAFPDMTTLTAQQVIIYVSILVYCNSVINPLIYACKLQPIRKRFLAAARWTHATSSKIFVSPQENRPTEPSVALRSLK